MIMQISSTFNPIPMPWIEKLFAKMIGYYGSKFTDMWSGSDLQTVKLIWADELGKLSAKEIADGVAKLMSQDWPPSLPQFVKLCRPSVDPVKAYYEAVEGMRRRELGEMGTWSSPAVFWAAVEVSAFDLKSMTYSQIKNRWEKALDEQIGRSEWEPIPVALVAIPYESKKLTRQEADERLKKLNADGIFKEKGDLKDWARRIMANPKNYPAISKKFAEEALGLDQKLTS